MKIKPVCEYRFSYFFCETATRFSYWGTSQTLYNTMETLFSRHIYRLQVTKREQFWLSVCVSREKKNNNVPSVFLFFLRAVPFLSVSGLMDIIYEVFILNQSRLIVLTVFFLIKIDHFNLILNNLSIKLTKVLNNI